MTNLSVLSAHLANRSDAQLIIPIFHNTPTGNNFIIDVHGNYWRMMSFIDDSITLTTLDTITQAHEVGRALGQFHYLLQDLSPTQLNYVLPNFHHTPSYLAHLINIIRHYSQQQQSITAIQTALRFIMKRRTVITALADAYQAGQITLRVTHGDPKLTNILFSRTTGQAIALIDLDTVQPGLLIHDIADCLRSCCKRNTAANELVQFDMDICAAILTAYAAQPHQPFNSNERSLLFTAIRLLPLELAIRFLIDHLEGDRYFKVKTRGDNLHKAHLQLDLVADIERHSDAVQSVIEQCFS